MQGRKSKASVIVVNFNGMPYLETCLSSILNQNYQDFEVILVDNCSSDESLDYIRQRFPDLTVVANESNLGYAVGVSPIRQQLLGDGQRHSQRWPGLGLPAPGRVHPDGAIDLSHKSRGGIGRS